MASNTCNKPPFLGNGTGAVADYTFGFKYINREDIEVYVGTINGVKTKYTEGSAANANEYQWQSDTVIRLNATAGTDNVIITRVTDMCDPVAKFYSGAAITAKDLNDNKNQDLFLRQELEGKLFGETGDGNGSEFWNRISSTISAPVQGQTIKSGETWQPDDNHIATAAAGDARWLQQQGGGGGTLTGGDMINVTGATISVDLAATSGLESTNPGNAAGELRIDVNDGCEIVAAGLNAETTDASIVQTGGNNNDPAIRIRKTLGTATNDDDLQISGGANITVTRNSASELTIAAPAVTGGSTFRGTVDVDNVNTLPGINGQQNPGDVNPGDAYTVENNVDALSVNANWNTVLANWVPADGIINSGDVILCTTGVTEVTLPALPTTARYNLIRTGGNINTLQQVTQAGNTTTKGAHFNTGKSSTEDFRIDGDNVDNLFFVDASADAICIGGNDTGGADLQILKADSAPGADDGTAVFSIGQKPDGSNEDHLTIQYTAREASMWNSSGGFEFDVNGAENTGGTFKFGSGFSTEFAEIAEGNTTVYGTTTEGGEISLAEDTNNLTSGSPRNNTVSLKAPATIANSQTITLPNAPPTVNNRFLRATGAGVGNDQELEWADAGSALTVQDEGTALATAATTLNFVGAGVTASGAGATKTITIPGGGGGPVGAINDVQVARLVDQKAVNTAGGASVSGWQVRTLNTEVYDDDALVALSGTNGFTLQPGEYLIEWSAPAYKSDRHQTALSTSTNAANIIALGSAEYNQTNSTSSETTTSKGSFKVNITAAQTYHILHYIETAATPNGLGVEANNGQAEIYTQVNITNLAGVTVNAAGDVNHITYNGAAAWGQVTAQASNGVCVVPSSSNIKSVTRTGQGLYSVLFETAMPSDNYSINATAITGDNTGIAVGYVNKNSNGFSLRIAGVTGNPFDGDFDFQVQALNAPPPKGGTGTDAWGTVFRNSAGNDFTIGGTYNIAKISYTEKCDGTTQAKQNGIYYVTFTTPMPNNRYSVTASLAQDTYGVDVTASDYDARGFTLSTVNSQQGVYTVAYSASFSVNATNAQLPNTISQEQLDAIFEGRAYNGVAAWGYVDSTNDITAGSNIKQVTGPTAAGAGIVNAYTVEFDNPMPNSDYAIIANIDNDLGGQAFVTPIPGSRTPTQFQVRLWTSTALAASGDWNFAVHALNAAPPKGGTGTDAWGCVDATGKLESGYNCTVTGNGNVNNVTFNTPMPSDEYSINVSSAAGWAYYYNKTAAGFSYQSIGSNALAATGATSFSVNATNAQLPVTVSQEQIEALARNPAVGAWGSCSNGTSAVGTNLTLDGSFNVNRVEHTGAGVYQVFFNTPMNNNDYSVVAMADIDAPGTNMYLSVNPADKTPESFIVISGPAANADTPRFDFQVIGATRNAAPLGGGADAWANVYRSSTNTITVDGSFNCTVSTTVKPDGTVVAAAEGTSYVTFTSPMPNANYAVVSAANDNSSSSIYAYDKTTNGFTVGSWYSAGNRISNTSYAVAVFATDGNAGGFWANDDGTLVPAKASDVTITGTLTCDDVVETGTFFSLKNIGTRLAALESGAISDDAVDSALLTLIAQLSERVTQLENT